MQPAGQFSSKLIGILAVVALLFPSSASVLCVAPGLHVEEEDINASCPAASAAVVPAEHPSRDGFNAAVAGHCIDIFLTPYSRGAVVESCGLPAPVPIVDQISDCNLPARASFLLTQSGTRGFLELVSPFPPVPLRC